MRECRLVVTMLIATVLVGTLSMPAAAEKTVQEWWEETFDITLYPYPGDGTQVGDRWPDQLDAWYTMELEEAGSANDNKFGWYDATNEANPGSTHQIFAGPDAVEATKRVYFGGVDFFGFYIDPREPGFDLMYTEDDANVDNFRAAWVFDHPTAEFGGWIIAWEDRNWGVPGDHNDMVVSIQKTPELPPSALLSLSMLPWGIAYLRGRRRKES